MGLSGQAGRTPKASPVRGPVPISRSVWSASSLLPLSCAAARGCVCAPFVLDKASSKEAYYSIAENRIMKVISQKQMKLAMDRIAGLLKEDGANQTLTVQEWLDAAQFHPAQFPTALPALEILGLLGFGDEMVQPETSA